MRRHKVLREFFPKVIANMVWEYTRHLFTGETYSEWSTGHLIPWNLAVHQENIYIIGQENSGLSDLDTQMICFNQETKAVQWKLTHARYNESSVNLCGVAFDVDQQQLLVTDAATNVVRVFSCLGQETASIRYLQIADPPVQIHVHGAEIFALTRNRQVCVRDVRSHEMIRSWDASRDASAANETCGRVSIAVSDALAPEVLIADAENSRVDVFSLKGTLRKTFTQFKRPSGVACLDGFFIIAHQEGMTVVESTGEQVCEWTLPRGQAAGNICVHNNHLYACGYGSILMFE